MPTWEVLQVRADLTCSLLTSQHAYLKVCVLGVMSSPLLSRGIGPCLV